MRQGTRRNRRLQEQDARTEGDGQQARQPGAHGDGPSDCLGHGFYTDCECRATFLYCFSGGALCIAVGVAVRVG
jgi:hypothetical protein